MWCQSVQGSLEELPGGQSVKELKEVSGGVIHVLGWEKCWWLLAVVQQLKLPKDGLSKALTSTQFKRLQVLSLGNGSVGKELNTHVNRPEFRFPQSHKKCRHRPGITALLWWHWRQKRGSPELSGLLDWASNEEDILSQVRWKVKDAWDYSQVTEPARTHTHTHAHARSKRKEERRKML